jgi:hypothetical protein
LWLAVNDDQELDNWELFVQPDRINVWRLFVIFVAFVVSRSVLAEMERVIQVIAPYESAESESVDSAQAGEQPAVLDQLHPEEADRSTI